MDNDSAHHANIALHMYLTGDYVSLVDHAGPYLDKPHLHFWLCAFSYKLFGVTAFAYKLPSFLFTILGTYSTFRLGKALYNNEVGKLAALIIASSFAYILTNNDVRMDAILTAAIAFSIWQLIAFIQNKKTKNIIGAALALAIGFSTKGHIAVFVPAVTSFFYIIYLKDWKLFLNWKWLLLLLLFGLFISPVVYCYYLQYNLHPEIIVRGKDHIDGVKFILINQSIERFGGEMGGDAKNDYLFFFHSFLWAFAPWSVVAYMALASRIKMLFTKKDDFATLNRPEWSTTIVFFIVAAIVSLSGFKLPHYINIIFPAIAVLTASYIISQQSNTRWIKSIFILQLILLVILLLLTLLINAWAFPLKKPLLIPVLVLLLAIVFYFIKSGAYNRLQKAITLSVASVALLFFLLNSNFYPQLLTFQGGTELAVLTKGKINPQDVYFWKDNYSSSFNFNTVTLRKEFTDTTIVAGKKIWLLYDIRNEAEVRKMGYQSGRRYTTPDYEITKLDIKFMNPLKRLKQCTTMVLQEIYK